MDTLTDAIKCYEFVTYFDDLLSYPGCDMEVELERPRLRSAKVYRPRTDNFDKWDEEQFRRRFRISKTTAKYVLEEIKDEITFESNTNMCIPAMEQLLIALRFYANGGTYALIGNDSGVHKATVGRIVPKVTSAIAKLMQKYIEMPSEDITDVQRRFFDIAAFPRVIGALDCTHVRISSPGGGRAEQFKNRKGYFSINVQAVVDANMIVRDIVVRWPGSVCDVTIYNNSKLCSRIERNEFSDAFILCDSAYRVGPVLLTPISTPATPEERLYNEAHKRTRSVVEGFFDVWKARFPILSSGIKQNVELAPRIIVACAVLHNIAQQHNDTVPELDEDRQRRINLYLQQENILRQIEANNASIVEKDSSRNAVIQYFQMCV